jgi:hypothetical protein
MKNYLSYLVGLTFLIGIQSCITVQVGSDDVSKNKSYVQDDLYDTEVLFTSKPKKNKQQEYYTSNDSDEIVIEEEEGIAVNSQQQNFLNSRSVYSNYDQGYSDGFRNGIFSNTPWNNWYSNPYINFGYLPFRTGLTISWGLSNFYNPWNSMYPYGMGYGLGSMYNLYDPFMDPFYRYYMPSYAYYPGYYNSYYANPYNYYSYLNSTSGYLYYGNNNVTIEQPARRVVRGPREDHGNNRYNENYSGGSRNVGNQYNGNFNNNANSQQAPANQQQRNIVQEYNRVQQRRNSNIEYSRPNSNDYQNSSRDQYLQQNRSTNFGNSNSNSGFSGGSGGSFDGGGSRGPR